VSTNDREQNEAERVGLPAMHDPGIYRLRVVGRLGPEWKDRFEGMNVIERTSPDPRGITELTVPVSDQTALLGVLGQLSEMQCAPLSVEVVSEGHRLDNQPTELEDFQANNEEAR
jgi:hypothetical protein